MRVAEGLQEAVHPLCVRGGRKRLGHFGHHGADAKAARAAAADAEAPRCGGGERRGGGAPRGKPSADAVAAFLGTPWGGDKGKWEGKARA